MKYPFLFCICYTLVHLSKSQSFLDGLSSGVKCAGALPGALSECQSKLKDRLDLVDKAEEKIGKDHKVDKTMFNCCYYAEFAHCLDVKTEQKCSKEVASYISTFAADFAKTLNSNCEGYNYTSPSCLFVVYLNVIVIIVLVLLALSVLSCVVGCLCRR